MFAHFMCRFLLRRIGFFFVDTSHLLYFLIAVTPNHDDFDIRCPPFSGMALSVSPSLFHEVDNASLEHYVCHIPSLKGIHEGYLP